MSSKLGLESTRDSATLFPGPSSSTSGSLNSSGGEIREKRRSWGRTIRKNRDAKKGSRRGHLLVIEQQPTSNREWKDHEGVRKWVAKQLMSGVCNRKATTYKSIPNAARLCGYSLSDSLRQNLYHFLESIDKRPFVQK